MHFLKKIGTQMQISPTPREIHLQIPNPNNRPGLCAVVKLRMPMNSTKRQRYAVVFDARVVRGGGDQLIDCCEELLLWQRRAKDPRVMAGYLAAWEMIGLQFAAPPDGVQ